MKIQKFNLVFLALLSACVFFVSSNKVSAAEAGEEVTVTFDVKSSNMNTNNFSYLLESKYSSPINTIKSQDGMGGKVTPGWLPIQFSDTYHGRRP